MNKYLAVKKVKAIDDYKLMLTFSNGEKRMFDMKPYLNKGIFKELRDVSLFNKVHISFDTVEWDNEADFDPEILYIFSKKIKDLPTSKAGKKYPASDSLVSSVAEPRAKYKKH